MNFRLSWNARALDAMQAYRNHDPEMSRAFERVLDQLRLTGTVPGSAFSGDSTSAHISSVVLPGYQPHVIVWVRQSDDRPHIVYVGPLDA